jgi:HD-GYP domain-containing protein (c-di-GMP phosphodiesterase class II)
LSQNDSVSFDWHELAVPVDKNSMAGWVALERQTIRIDDVYQLPPTAAVCFDRTFDQRTGYRTRSMICTPLVTSRGDVIGVLQLINKKSIPERRLSTPRDVDEYVVPFDQHSEELLIAVASQAGIALENALLYDEIRGLFEGFVRASVDAIESRDPTTSGHSRRVAALSLRLASAVERSGAGAFASVRWQAADLRELEYAALLHDFGKIGVREQVLTKARKLHDHELGLIRSRFDFIAKAIEANAWRSKCEALMCGTAASELAAIDGERLERMQCLQDAWTMVMQANEPTVLPSGHACRLQAFGNLEYEGLDGVNHTWLTPSEIASLSVSRGSLTSTEFEEIRGHVTHTYRFLSQIPWGKTFARVPIIASAHHERLDGTGYPRQLISDQIPLQAKIMSVADIFDALTASDRPYKRAVPTDKALEILGLEVDSGHLDAELVRLFAQSRAWEGIDTAG